MESTGVVLRWRSNSFLRSLRSSRCDPGFMSDLLTLEKRTLPHPAAIREAGSSTFSGFRPPSSNATYTPNQFFDVCLRHYSRGVVRLVGYMIRKTLGWCDEFGRPQEEQIRTSYTDLIRHAGISRDMIRKALDDAVEARFLDCVKSGKPSSSGETPQPAFHQLRWDPSKTYRKQPDAFSGFFDGEGNRTYVPNEFFDVVVAKEPLAVIKVVGAILRSSIGFEARRGHRRQNVALSYRNIQSFTRIGSKRTLSKALQTALAKRYIVRVEEGVFSPDGDLRKSAVYAPCWADSLSGQIWIPEQSEKETSRKGTPGNQSEMNTSLSPFSPPGRQSERETNIKMKHKNETNNKEANTGFLQRRKALLDEGISPDVAERLAHAHTLEEIEKQVRWLDARNPKKSRAGLLRLAIEQNFGAPASVKGRIEPHRTPRVEADSTPSEQHARGEHQERFFQRYLVYLREEETRIQREDSDEYTRFLASRAAERSKIAAMKRPWHDPDYLTRYDSEESRLAAMQPQFGLLSFWAWDSLLNPTPLDSNGGQVSGDMLRRNSAPCRNTPAGRPSGGDPNSRTNP